MMKRTGWPLLYGAALWFLTECVSVNFSAYFNTFYNIRRIVGRIEVLETKGDTLRVRPLYDSLETKCAYLIKYYPNSKYLPDAVFYLGLAFSRKGQYEKAVKKFEEFLEFFPKHKLVPRAKLELGRVYALDPRYRYKAVDILKNLESDEAKFWISYVYYNLGDYSAARKYISQIRISKRNPWAKRYILLAVDIFTAVGEFDTAQKYLRVYLSLDLLPSERKVAEEKRGDILSRMERYDEAIKVYKSIDYTPRSSDDGMIKMKMGDIYLKIGDTSKSIESFEACFSSSYPNKWQCGYEVANLYILKGDFDKASRFYDAIYTQGGAEWKSKAATKKLVLDEWRNLRNKDDPSSLYRKAEIYFFHLQSPDTAVRIWENLSKAMDKNVSPKSLYALVYIYLGNGDTLKARNYFVRLKNEYKTSTYTLWAYKLFNY